MVPKGSYTIRNREAVSDSFDDFCRTIGWLKWKPAEDVLIDVVKRHPHRSAAVMALGEIGDPKAIPALRPLATDSDGRLRFETIDALTALGDGQCVTLLIEHLKQPYEDGVFPECREIILRCRRLRDRRIAQPLRDYIARPDAKFRRDAELSLALVEEDDTDKRAARIAPLLAGLTEREDWSVTCDIIEEIGRCRSQTAVPVLLKYAKPRREGLVPKAAIESLANTGGPEAVRGLVSLFSEDYSQTNAWKFEPVSKFRELIGEALEHATGQKFDTDAGAWRQWVRQNMSE